MDLIDSNWSFYYMREPINLLGHYQFFNFQPSSKVYK